MTDTPKLSDITYCENHPDRATNLRCNRCNKLICAKCAVRTPTGYRCEECIRNQSKIFDTAKNYDYVLAFSVAAILSLIGSIIASFVGFFIYLIFLVGPAAGAIIASAVQRVVQKRRSKYLFITATVGVVVGGLITSVPSLIFGFDFFSLLWKLIYVGLAASTAYTRLSGIQMRL